jgi:hypothetical protein
MIRALSKVGDRDSRAENWPAQHPDFQLRDVARLGARFGVGVKPDSAEQEKVSTIISTCNERCHGLMDVGEHPIVPETQTTRLQPFHWSFIIPPMANNMESPHRNIQQHLQDVRHIILTPAIYMKLTMA